MFKHTPTGKTIIYGEAWSDENGTQHPGNWNIWLKEERLAHGIVEIIEETPPDSRLYDWGQNPDGTITKTPKDLDDVKSAQVALVKTQQGAILAQTDWAYTRLADIDKAVPEPIKTYRDAVRAAAAAMVAAINGATTTDAMATVFASEIMKWPTGDDK
jgi:hypothetical protein